VIPKRLLARLSQGHLQNVPEAKPYQVRQLLRLVERYNLHLEETP
jgi:hypothetical protein